MSASIWNPNAPVSNTINPIAPVPFVKGTAALPGITFAGDTNTGIWSGADGTIYFSINGTTVLSLQADGTVASNGVLSIDTEAELPSAATIDLGGQGTNALLITGSTNITSFGVNYNGPIFVRFAGALTLTNSSTLILPSSANIVTAANDTAVVCPKTTSGIEDGWIVVSYQKASGAGLTVSSDLSNSVRIDVASAATVDLTSGTIGAVRNINITGTTGINGFTISAGSLFFVRFAGVLTLTNSANLQIQSGANVTTGPGDTCILRALSANTVELLCYVAVSTRTLPDPTGNAGKVVGTTDGVNFSFVLGLAPGLMMMWPTDAAPTGWLECDGSSLLRAGTYAGLFAIIGTLYGAADGTHFNLPDYRGRFLRGWAHGSANDPDRATRTVPAVTGATLTAGDHVGTQQPYGIEAHTHTGAVGGIGATGAQISSGLSQNTGSYGGNETRPLNTNAMIVIKY